MIQVFASMLCRADESDVWCLWRGADVGLGDTRPEACQSGWMISMLFEKMMSTEPDHPLCIYLASRRHRSRP
jgi:hypothetical protein